MYLKNKLIEPTILTRPIQLFRPGMYASMLKELSAAGKEMSPAKKQIADAWNDAQRKYHNLVLFRAYEEEDLFLMSASDNFPTRDGTVVETFFHATSQPIDLGWTALYDMRDYRNTREEDFEIHDVTDGIQFRFYENGERVELATVTGTIAKFPFQRTGGGFQWEKEWLEDNKFWRLEDGMQAAATRHGNFQAVQAYATITAAGIVAEARSTTAGASVVQLDVETINFAATNILADMFAADDFVDPNPSFFLLFNNLTPGYPERIQGVMRAQLGIPNDDFGAAALAYSTIPIGTPHVGTGVWYLVYPRRKLKGGIRADLMMWEKFDITQYAGANVFWARWTHARGATEQVRSITLS